MTDQPERVSEAELAKELREEAHLFELHNPEGGVVVRSRVNVELLREVATRLERRAVAAPDVVEALAWYRDEVEALHRHMGGGDKSKINTVGMEAVLTVLSLDAGRRARTALASPPEGGESMTDISALVERLRDIGEAEMYAEPWTTKCTITEAADALERLQRERGRISKAFDDWGVGEGDDPIGFLIARRVFIIRQTREECALVVERVFNEWKKDDSLRDMLEEMSASILALPEEHP